jgi:hypothetical protein
MAGKGDKQRLMDISKEQFDNNWDNIFNKKKPDLIIEKSESLPNLRKLKAS